MQGVLMVSKNPHRKVGIRLDVTFADEIFEIALMMPMSPFIALLFIGGSLFQCLIQRNVYYLTQVS